MLVWLRPERGPAPQGQRSEVPPATLSRPATPPPTTDGPAPAAEPERVAVEDAPRENWNERYLATDGFFAFVAGAAPAAIGGDARAQYLISRALLKCQVQLVVENELPYAYALRNARRLCERFHTAHPLDAFDLPVEAKSFTYWRDEALANGDALAAVADASRLFGLYEAERDPATKEQLRRQALAGIRVAVDSRDPEAIMTISSFVQRPPTAREPWMSASWLVAACELGLDCSKPPPALARECATSQVCVGIYTVADLIQAVGYPADVYAAGQDIAYKIKIGDWEGLQTHLALRD
jgi:hypothetical protein